MRACVSECVGAWVRGCVCGLGFGVNSNYNGGSGISETMIASNGIAVPKRCITCDRHRVAMSPEAWYLVGMIPQTNPYHLRSSIPPVYFIHIHEYNSPVACPAPLFAATCTQGLGPRFVNPLPARCGSCLNKALKSPIVPGLSWRHPPPTPT
jgi:hypothetical protein